MLRLNTFRKAITRKQQKNANRKQINFSIKPNNYSICICSLPRNMMEDDKYSRNAFNSICCVTCIPPLILLGFNEVKTITIKEIKTTVIWHPPSSYTLTTFCVSKLVLGTALYSVSISALDFPYK